MTATPPLATGPAQAITPRAWRVLAVTSLGVFIVLLDTTINIAFPAITAFPSTTRAALSWVLNAYAIVFAALLITAGRTSDQLGRRRMFLTGLASFAATSAACGLAPTLPALVAGRALQRVHQPGRGRRGGAKHRPSGDPGRGACLADSGARRPATLATHGPPQDRRVDRSMDEPSH